MNLVERFRERFSDNANVLEAADRIEALEAELKAARESHQETLCEWRDHDATFERELASAQAEIEQLKATPPEKREDLRCVISDLCDQVRERNKNLAACQAENLKLREALNDGIKLVRFLRLDDNDEITAFDNFKRKALSTPPNTTALTEYRNGVIEECAKVCASLYRNMLPDRDIDSLLQRHGFILDDAAEAIRAMKEKP